MYEWLNNYVKGKYQCFLKKKFNTQTPSFNYKKIPNSSSPEIVRKESITTKSIKSKRRKPIYRCKFFEDFDKIAYKFILQHASFELHLL